LALSRRPRAPTIPILITDLPILLPLQERNVQLNDLSPSQILSASFPWGGPIPDTVPEAYRRPEVVLAADCVYFEPAFPLLMETLTELFKEGQDIPDIPPRDPLCFFCMKKRRKADMRFVAALKKAFSVKEIDPEIEDEEEKGVHL